MAKWIFSTNSVLGLDQPENKTFLDYGPIISLLLLKLIETKVVITVRNT